MLRVPPFRGDVVASGVVALGVLVVLLQLRMGWADGVHLAVAAVACAGVGLLLGGCPREPRPYVSAIVVAFLVLLAVGLARLASVLGADALTSGATPVWLLLLFGLCAATVAWRFDAAAATLGAALAVVLLPVAFFAWVLDPSAGVERTLLLLAVVVLALGVVATRDRRPAHAAQLANAAGAGLLAIAAQALTSIATVTALDAAGPSGTVALPGAAPSLGWGWELCLVAGGLGLLAYGAVDRQRGPVLLGLAVVLSFVVSAAVGDDGRLQADTLLGWPILLGLGAAGLLVIGLRPTTPAPAPPDAADEPPAPLPLR